MVTEGLNSIEGDKQRICHTLKHEIAKVVCDRFD